jgi:hypothetical protein
MEVRWATVADLELVAALDEEVYGARDQVPRALARSWFDRNDRMIRLLVGPQGALLRQPADSEGWPRREGQGSEVRRRRKAAFLGYYWIVPVRGPALSEFVAGRLTERDFRAEDIASPEEMFACEEMYLCSMAMRHRHSKALLVLIEDLVALVEEYRTKGRLRRLYAIAASIEGTNLLHRHLGFHLLVPGSERRDQHDAYVRELEPADK